jgi:hypothetical protein
MDYRLEHRRRFLQWLSASPLPWRFLNQKGINR